jgi:hypothetical protein
MESNTLGFGYNRQGNPSDRPLWGARAIYKAGSSTPLDYVWDRQSVVGRDRDGAGGLSALKPIVSLASRNAQERVRDLYRKGHIDPQNQDNICLSGPSDPYVMWGRACGGYMYLVCWAKDELGVPR